MSLACCSASRRFFFVVCFLALALQLVALAAARADTPAAPAPRYVPDVVPGTRCVGAVPCPFIGPTGATLKLRLFAAILDDKSLYNFRLDLLGAVSLLQRVELGVVLPISFYQPLSPTYERLQVYATAEVLPRSLFPKTYVSGFLHVRFPLGAFNGASTPAAGETSVDVGAALVRNFWLLSAQPAMWLTAGAGRLELHAGLGLALRGDWVWPYAQVRMDSRMGCSAAQDPQCSYGFVVVAGAAFPSDFGTSGIAYAKGLSGAHAPHAIAAELSFGYNEAVARKHGDGVAAAQAWWQRQFDALRDWQARRRAEAIYGALLDELQNDLWRQQQALQNRCQGPACGAAELPPLGPPSSSPGDTLNEGDAQPRDPGWPSSALPITPAFPEAALPSVGPTSHTTRPQARHHRRRWDPRTEPVPALRPDSVGLWEASLAPYNEAFEEWKREQDAKEQRLRWQAPPVQLPTMDKVYINALALLWFEAATMFLQVASPDSAAKVEEMRSYLRPLKYTQGEAEMGRAMEGGVSTLMQMGLGAALEAGLVRTASNVVVAQGQAAAAQIRTVGTLAAEAEALGARVSESMLRRAMSCIGRRCNPANYRVHVRGLGSNFGNVEVQYVGPPAAGEAAHAEVAAAWTEAPNAATHVQYQQTLKVTQQANELVESLRSTGKLPDNYITKSTAEANGWLPGKALHNHSSDAQIGGDVFKNTSKVVPEAPGRVWYEADVGLSNKMSRAKQPGTRLLYSNDGELYITTDHYETSYHIGRWK